MVEFADRIKPSDAAITTYLDLLASKYQIPTFQRDVVWDEDKVKRLWDSVFRYYPIGSILVWRTETKLQKHRQIGGFPIDKNFDHRSAGPLVGLARDVQTAVDIARSSTWSRKITQDPDVTHILALSGVR